MSMSECVMPVMSHCQRVLYVPQDCITCPLEVVLGRHMCKPRSQLPLMRHFLSVHPGARSIYANMTFSTNPVNIFKKGTEEIDCAAVTALAGRSASLTVSLKTGSIPPTECQWASRTCNITFSHSTPETTQPFEAKATPRRIMRALAGSRTTDIGQIVENQGYVTQLVATQLA